MSVVAGNGAGPVNLQKDVPLFKPTGKAFGHDYFDAPDTKTYDLARFGKKKYGRWDTYLGKGDWGQGVKGWATKNPKKSFLVKNPSTKSYMFMRKTP